MSAPKAVLVALSFAAFAVTASAQASAQNWALQYVRAREAAQIARVLGDEAANRFLGGPAPAIVGGGTALPGAWPAQVALLVKGVANNFDAQFCGGTLIHKRFVLTAAHCSDFLSSPAQVQVLTGTQSLIAGGVRRNVVKISIHQYWTPSTFAFDVAVWELAADVPHIVPAAMIQRIQEPFAGPNVAATVTGWGTTSEGGISAARLRQVTVPIIRRDICNRPASYDGNVTAQMICAGRLAGGKDSCLGDSGGPLWVRSREGRHIVAGITSWGFGCARPDYPGVYTRLAAFSGWVTRVIAAAGH